MYNATMYIGLCIFSYILYRYIIIYIYICMQCILTHMYIISFKWPTSFWFLLHHLFPPIASCRPCQHPHGRALMSEPLVS